MSDQMDAPSSSEQPTPSDAEATPATPAVESNEGASDAASAPQSVTAPEGEAVGAEAQPASSEAAAAEATATEGQAVEGQAASEEGAAEGKRKRRRRRKKKSGEDAGGEDKPKKESHAPFAHLFAGGAGKRHAFAAGEVVAGRVVRAEDGAYVIDLFGKAQAFADEHEPREVPPAPEPVQESVAEPSDGQSTEGAPEAPPADATGSEEAVASEEAAASEEAPTAAPEPAEATPAEAAPSAEPPVDATEAAPSAEPAPVEPAATTVVDESAPADITAPTEAGAEAAREAGAEAAHVAEEESSEGSDEASEAPKGPLAPAPVVPEEYPRLEPLATGAIFKGRVGSVSESGHIVIVNRNVVRAEVRADIARYREERRRVEGLVYGYNRGGFDVLVQGVRAFCPASAISLHEIKDPNEFLGRKYEFLLPASKGGKDIVVSRRSILERQARKRAKEVLRSLEAGQVLDGTVTSVRDFGVFVDLGGVEGLVHQSELTHGFGVKPADVASPGDQVKVKVLRVGGDPSRKGDKKDRLTRVSLSMKALQEDPWDAHQDEVKEGVVREGKVTRTTDFGAFIELVPDVEGLLHISELGRDLQHANQALSEGDIVPVVIERMDRKARRISLSKLSDAELEEYKAGTLNTEGGPKNMRPGARIEVTVDRADNRGVVVRIPGVIGRRARGFIPASETGTDRGSDLRKQFPAGETLEVKVIGNDRDGGLKCSVKALAIDEERKAVKDYRREASKQGFGTFGDLLKAKLGQSKEG